LDAVFDVAFAVVSLGFSDVAVVVWTRKVNADVAVFTEVARSASVKDIVYDQRVE
jgi:hypothetical protein